MQYTISTFAELSNHADETVAIALGFLEKVGGDSLRDGNADRMEKAMEGRSCCVWYGRLSVEQVNDCALHTLRERTAHSLIILKFTYSLIFKVHK